MVSGSGSGVGVAEGVAVAVGVIVVVGVTVAVGVMVRVGVMVKVGVAVGSPPLPGWSGMIWLVTSETPRNRLKLVSKRTGVNLFMPRKLPRSGRFGYFVKAKIK